MAGSANKLIGRPPAQRWLRYEIARLTTWRNLLLAGIIAAGTCGVVFTVVITLRPHPAAPKPATSSAIPETLQTQDQAGVQPTLPTRIFTHADAEPGAQTSLQQEYYGVDGERLIPTTQEMRGKISEYLVQNGILEGFDLFDVQEATGHSISNVVYVERGKKWEHAIVIMPKDRLQHLYFFSYLCGHRATTTPDPYRDLMYARPQNVADRYAKRLCSECESMRRHLDAAAHAPAQAGGK